MPTNFKKIFLIVGTRPEFIKLAPLYLKMKELNLKPFWIQTNQHKELLDDLKKFWKIYPDFEFNLENKNLSLAELSSQLLLEASLLFEKEKPNLVIVQGDTLSAAEAAKAAFFLKQKLNIRIAHVEAGLRTQNILSPFPEEFNRRTISEIADYHFCPSQNSFENLCKEKNINPKIAESKNIFLTGNTGIDALLLAKDRIKNPDFQFSKEVSDFSNKKYVLITSHRKENLENNMQGNLCEAIYKILKSKNNEINFLISLHSNPLARKNFIDLDSRLKSESIKGLTLIDTCSYPQFIKLLENSLFIITDSGGIQEEAPYLNKYALILREELEREEVYLSGFAEKLENDLEQILNNIQITYERVLQNDMTLSKENHKFYGDGNSSESICKTLNLLTS
ncbi:MAG: UDP-N-acetylglucosamine 2-epimerase (non-hydrolyzing) [Candidatus Caenarcaniphilales bacterium]|nr:UDP-N-acetylglucosamine 2-epimerase (non-hydrolyzing) [Candidatus Caenarcaniphilales bacterium]